MKLYGDTTRGVLLRRGFAGYPVVCDYCGVSIWLEWYKRSWCHDFCQEHVLDQIQPFLDWEK